MKKRILIFSCLCLVFLVGCDKELKCDEGYQLQDNFCVKEIDHTDAKEVLVCPESFELKEDTCYKLEEIDYQEKYSCNEGLTLEDTKCIGTSKKTLATQYKCSTGTLEEKQCVTLNEKPDSLVKTPKCDSGWTVDGSYCIKGELFPLGCDWENGDRVGCHCEGSDRIGSDGLCHNAKPVSYEYSCRGNSILKDNKCYEKISIDAESYQGCEEGYTKEGTNCIKKINVSATKTKYCEEGFELNNNKCKKETILKAKTEYNCPDEFEYINELCRKYEKVEAK